MNTQRSGWRRAAAILGAAAMLLVTTGGSRPTFDPLPDLPDSPRIMFVGDSLTGSPGCWRAGVWQTLRNDGYEFHAVGPRTADECGGVTDAQGNLWEPDNAGYGGASTNAIVVRVLRDGLIDLYQPDIVVLLIGTNDMMSRSTADAQMRLYTSLLSYIRLGQPNVALVIGTLPPMSPEKCSCQDTIDQVNGSLAAWAVEQSTPESPVTVAVIHEGFDYATDTDDGIHPNASGVAKLAVAWVAPIEAALDAYELRSATPDRTATNVAVGIGAIAVMIAGLAYLFATRPRPMPLLVDD